MIQNRKAWGRGDFTRKSFFQEPFQCSLAASAAERTPLGMKTFKYAARAAGAVAPKGDAGAGRVVFVGLDPSSTSTGFAALVSHGVDEQGPLAFRVISFGAIATPSTLTVNGKAFSRFVSHSLVERFGFLKESFGRIAVECCEGDLAGSTFRVGCESPALRVQGGSTAHVIQLLTRVNT